MSKIHCYNTFSWQLHCLSSLRNSCLWLYIFQLCTLFADLAERTMDHTTWKLTTIPASRKTEVNSLGGRSYNFFFYTQYQNIHAHGVLDERSLLGSNHMRKACTYVCGLRAETCDINEIVYIEIRSTTIYSNRGRLCIHYTVLVQNIKDKKVHLHNTNISRNKRLRPIGINSNGDLYTDEDENTCKNRFFYLQFCDRLWRTLFLLHSKHSFYEK